MGKKLHKIKLLCFCLTLLVLNIRSKAQLAIAVTPSIQCYNNLGSTTASAVVTATQAGAVSYSWSVFGSGCNPSVIVTGSNGISINITYTCCGTYTIVCFAYNGVSSLLNTINQTASVLCPPTISINGLSNLCPGSTTTLSANGALNYTWTPGFSNTSQIIVSPLVSTCYTVTGSNASGCLGQASSCVTVQPFPSAGFNHTLNNNGNVTFTSTSSPTTALSSYTWNFGNNTSTITTNNVTSASTNYTTNGLYTVTLSFSSGTLCSSVATATSLINVSTASCNLAAGFTYSQGLAGFVSFNNTSTGTVSGVGYTWYFGDNTSSFSSSPAHTYSSNGTYTVKLVATNNFTNTTCKDSISVPITINSYTPCNLVANFSITATANNAANFKSTSTGTVASSTFIWNYGDGSNGIGATSSHTYSSSGTYITTLTVNNNYTPSCSSTKTLAVSVSSLCNVLANYTHTVSSLGQVLFNSSSSTISPHTKYYWNFGDGIYATSANPSHTYNNGGTYLVTLRLTDTLTVCKDTLTQSINITGIPCTANSNFTLLPSGTPQSWNAIPIYPWNVTSAIWTWGDGTTDTILYTSHLYSVSAMYTICLSVTVSCGANSTSCTSYSVFRSPETSASDILSINVIPPAMSTGIPNTYSENVYSSLYPNPNNGEFTLSVNGVAKNTFVTIYNVLGELVYHELCESDNGNLVKNINLPQEKTGIYFLTLEYENVTLTRKILIYKE